MSKPKYKYYILLYIGSDESDIQFRAGYYTNDEFKPYIDIASPDGKKWTFEFESRYDAKPDSEYLKPGMSQLVYRYREQL